MKKQYRYPTELLHDSYWQGKPKQHSRVQRVLLPNTAGNPCAMCGRTDFQSGYNTYETSSGSSRIGYVLSTTFGDQFLLAQPHSPFVCPYCESVTRDEFRAYNGIIATPDSVWTVVGKGRPITTNGHIRQITMAHCYEMMLEPPEPPFIFAFNRGGIGKNGTHYVYLSTVNYSRDNYQINYYTDRITVDRTFLKEIWHRIVKEDPSSSKMSAMAIRYGDMSIRRQQEALRRLQEREGQTNGNTKIKETNGKKKPSGSLPATFKASDFATDPNFLGRALLHDNFRTLELFFRSIASLNAGRQAEEKKQGTPK